MSSFRVTTGSIASTSIANLQAALSRYQTAEDQASSGRRISKPSDAPGDTATAMSTRGQLARLAQYSRNADSGTDLLNTADTALQSTLTSLDRARDLVVQSMNSGGGTDNNANATELSSLRDGVLALANTTSDGVPIFAGASGTTQAYSADGTYQGDDNSLQRQVGSGLRVAVTVPGTTAFGAAGSDVMSVLKTAATNVANGTVSATDLNAIDAAIKTVTGALTTVGTSTNRISDAKTAATDSTSTLTTRLSDLEDVDAPTALISLQTQETAYQAALAATGKIMQSSLLDFLK